MKKLIFYCLFAISSLAFSQDQNKEEGIFWQGGAVKGTANDFPKDGYIAISNVFENDEEILIGKVGIDKIVKVKVKRGYLDPGIFLVLSPKVASDLGITDSTNPVQVKAVQSKFPNLLKNIADTKKTKDTLEAEEKTVANDAVNSDKTAESPAPSTPSIDKDMQIKLLPVEKRYPPASDKKDIEGELKLTQDIDRNKYYIQFASNKDSYAVKNSLSKFSDLSGIVVYKSKDMYRSLFGPFSTRDAAIKYLEYVKEIGFKDSYIRLGSQIVD